MLIDLRWGGRGGERKEEREEKENLDQLPSECDLSGDELAN